MSNNLMRKQAIKVGKMVELPESWAVKQIKETMDLESGVWGKEDESGYPVLRSTNFTESGYIDFEEVTYRDIPDRKIDDKKLKKGDVLLEISGGGPKQPVGRVVFFDEKENKDYLFGNFVKRLRLKDKLSEENDPFYIFRFLERYYDIGQTETLQHQTTGIRNLDYRAYMSLPLPLPPFPEQKKIASILLSVDKSIEKTDEVIEETKELKKGLMKELLTKGIGHSEFKEVTALGQNYTIPKDWSLKELNEVLKVIRNGSSKKQNKQGQGLPVSRIETISDGTINYDKVGYVDLEPEDLKKHELEKGDVLFSHINSIAHIGKVAQYKADKKLYHGMNLLKLRFDNKIVTDQFMLHRLKSINAKHFYERYAKQAVNQASLNQKDVGLYTFPLPSLEEQKKIASIISLVESKIKKEEEYKAKLERLKKGLMQKLLTGEIRVNTEMEV